MAGSTRNPWEENYSTEGDSASSGKPWEQSYQEPAKPKDPSIARSLGDSAIALGTGVVQGAKMLSDVAGADNAVSRSLSKGAKFLTNLESPYRKAEKQARAEKIKQAEESGSTWEEVKAHVGGFAEAPLDTTLNALGTSAPTIAAGLLTGGTSTAAVAGARVAQAGLGIAQGVGGIKGSIHEAVKQKHLEAGASDAEATQRADAAQAYSGDNLGSIATGGALGLLAGTTGAESAVRRIVGRQVAEEAAERAAPGLLRSTAMGAVKEAPMEGLQGGQERLASNLALQGEGFDVPTWQGVAGQAALESLASAPVGGGFGAMEALGRRPVQPNADPALEPGAPGAQDAGAETGPMLALPAPDRGVIEVASDGTARTPAYQTPGYVGDVTDVEPKIIDPVREQVATAAAQGGALSSAALTAIDTGAAAAVQPAEPEAALPAPISLEEADAHDRAAYEQFFASADAEPVVARYFENDDDIPDFDAASNVSDEDFLRALGATDEDIQDAIATARQPASPQSRPAVDAGAQANEPAGTGQGAGADQAAQGQVAPRQPSNFTGTPTATIGQQGATARPGPGFGLKDALAQIRAKKQQEAANAQAATPEAAPAAAALPAARTGAVEAAGVEQQGPGADAGNGFKQGPKKGERYRVGVSVATGGVTLEKRLPAGTAATFYVGKDGGLVDADDVNLVGTKDREKLWTPTTPEQASQATAILDEMGRLDLTDPKRKDAKARLKALVTATAAMDSAGAAGSAPDIKAITAKQIPDMTDGELQAAIAHYGPENKRTAKLQKEVQRRAGAPSSATTEGTANVPQTAQAQQASPQPAQAGAAPAAGPAPTNTAAPTPAGTSTVRALTDGAPAENTGAQAAPAAGAQGEAQGGAVEALRQQLRDVEARIVQAAPAALGQGGGDIEAAMKSRKVPVTLKAQRKKLKEQLQQSQGSQQNQQQAKAQPAQEATENVASNSTGRDDKAHWLKSVADMNRMSGQFGAQIDGVANGRLSVVGSPNATKQGRALMAAVDEARRAGATNEEIAQAAAGRATTAPVAAELTLDDKLKQANDQQAATEQQATPVRQSTETAYTLPSGSIGDEWRDDQKRSPEHPDFTPTPRQQRLMNEVKKALDGGAIYNDDVTDKVAKALGVSDEVLASNRTGVQGGDFGYDVYHARKAVEAQAQEAEAAKIRAELNLQPGDKLGTLIFNDFKQTNSVEVVSITEDGRRANFKGKRGAATVAFEATIPTVKFAIERAHERGKRKDSYEEFIAGRAADKQATAQPAGQAKQAQVATENVAEAIPIFERYDDAMAWMKDRAKSQGLSVIAYRATDEFKNALSPQLQALYAASKSKWDADTAEAGKAMQDAMAKAGIRPGDTVQWSQPGAFLTTQKLSGVVKLDRLGVPHVHMSSEVAVAKAGGKIGYTKKLRWQPYMQKPAESASQAVTPVDDAPRRADTAATDSRPAQEATAAEQQQAAQAQEITHNGTRIYPAKIKVGDEVKSMWAVESPDNQRRRAAGERAISGDSLHDTLDQAKAAAERETKRDAERQAAKAEQDAADKERLAAEEARKAANRHKSVVERHKDAVLSKQVRDSETGNVMTRREWVENKVASGLKTSITQEDKIKPMSRMQAFRADNRQQAEHDRKVKEAGKKDVYWLGDFEVTKTEYDYAQELKAQRAAAQQAEAAPAASSQQATDDFLPEGWTKSINGYTKRPVYRMEQGGGQPFAVVTQVEGMQYEVQIRHGDKQLIVSNQTGALSEVLAKAETELTRMTQADSVTHQDPGEKAEAATPGVVTDSLKKAARNEDTKPSEMRKWLVAEIDKALLNAPDRADYDEAVKRMGEKDAISMYTGNGLLGKNAETGFVTFDVPGDGKFKVRNSVRGLLEFRKNASASQGFKDNGQKPVKPEEVDGVRSGSGGRMAAIVNMIEEGDFEAARDYAEAVGISLDDVKVPKGDRKPEWEQFRKDGTLPPPPDTRPQPAPKTAAQLDEEKRQQQEAEAKKPKDTGWNMAGTGYAGKRYIGRNITTDDGREIVARVYENAGVYEEAEVKVDGVRKFTVTDRYNAQDKADAFIKTLMAGEKLDLKGFERIPKGNGYFDLRDGNMTVSVEPMGQGKYQASFRGAKSSPHLIGEQGAVDWAANYREESQRADAKTKDKAKPFTPPAGYKPAGEPFYRGGKLVQGYAPFAPGERVTMKDSAGQSGVIESLASPDDSGVFASAVVKFDNGMEQMVQFGKLEASAAQPITRADVEDAQQQAAAIITERIDAMTAGELNKIAKQFLPTMGMKPTMSKANNKAAMTDPKINLEAAAAEVGATLPAEVTRALQADMEGRVVDVAQDEGVTKAMGQAQTESQAPASKTAELQSNTPAIDAHIATMDAVRAGKATPEQFKASFEAVLANADAIKVELKGKTKAELLADGGPYIQMRHTNSTKPDIVDAVYRAMLDEYTLGQGFSYGMGRDSYQNAVRRLVDATDADKLAQFVKEREAALEESKTRREATAKAMENPQTLDDFRALMRAKATAGMGQREAFLSLTPEQRIRYDDLAAESTRAAREASKQAQKTQVQAAGQTTAGEIIATKHTRDGYDLFVVKLADRLSKEDYSTVLASAKKLGGWYSAFRGNGAIPGFQFKDKANAEAFLALAGGDTTAAQEQVTQRRDAFEDDRSQTAVERLRAMADKLESSATEEENRDRKTNTGRRARFARAALDAAASDKALAKTMRNIAKAIESGRAKFLDMVRTKTQVDFFANAVKTAKDAELRAKYPSYADQEKRKGEPATAETADHADFPSYSAFRSDLAMLARQLLEVDGTKKLGQRLMSVADDVTDAYMEFAKENLSSVSQFGTKSGGLAEYANREAVERAIRRSGLTGRAIVLPIKRGENRIILSPSEAINKGIWTGDGDKRITLTRDFGNELVQAIGRRGNRQNQLAVPWQFQNAHDRLKMLERMGIQTSSEFRAALREFIGLKEEAVQNRARTMELEMVGRKADGLDFFPTPATVADQMVEAADLTPDMAVLEPSAGMGHLADRIRASGAEPDVIEMSGERRELLEEKGYRAAGEGDFLSLKPSEFFTFGDVFRAPDGTEGIMRGASQGRVRLEDEQGKHLGFFDRDELTGVRHRGTESGYDRIIMNPPFSNRRDAEHVRHAYSLLKPGGRIVAIMGEGVFFGQDKKAQDFREWLESVGGTSEKLPEGSFMDPSLPVNTSVNARMVVIDKADSVAMFSRTPTTQAAIGTPAATIRAAITKAYGKLLGQLESKGLVTLTQTEDEAIEAAAQARAAKTGQSVERGRARLHASIRGESDELSMSIYSDEAGKIERALEAMGLQVSTEGSRISQSTYVIVESPEYTQTEGESGSVLKIRVSDHRLPGGYQQPDFEVQVGNAHQGVDMADAAGAWFDAVRWVGRRFGVEPKGAAKRQIAAAAEKEAKAKQAAVAAADQQRNSLDTSKARLQAWLQSLPDGALWGNARRGGWVAVLDGKMIGRFDGETATGEGQPWYGGPYPVEAQKNLQPVRESLRASVKNSVADPDIRRSANGAIQGFFDPQTGQSFLIADNLTAEAAPGVLMHEVGIHMAADGSMKALFNRAAMMLKLQRGNPFMKAVQARMDAAGETSGEEAAAYIAEAYENDRANAPASVQRWLADLLAAVKAWMFKKGIMGADRLTVADIAAVARANARSMARGGGATGGQGFGPAFSRNIGDAMPHPFTGFTREKFLGKPKITPDSNAKDLIPSGGKSIDDKPAVPFSNKWYPNLVARYSENGAAVYDGEKVIASYYFGDTLVVDKKYRRAGIGSELVYQWRMRNPNSKTAATRTKKSQALQEKVWDRVQRELYQQEYGPAFSHAPAGDQTQTEAFKRWFKDSKVVDAEGKPLVVYHASTYGDFSVFDKSEQRKGMAGFGFYFTDAKGSSIYADHAEQFKMARNWKGEDKKVNIMPAYLSMQKPLVIDNIADVQARYGKADPGAFGVGREIAGLSADAKTAIQRAGFDGVMTNEYVKRMKDGSLTVVNPGDKGAMKHPVYVVFEPEQIKSAIGNNGNFDPSNPDIRFSRADMGSRAGMADDVAKRVGAAVKSVTVSNVKQRAGFKLTDYLGIGLQALGRRQIVDIYGDMLPLAEYNQLVTQMEADKNEGGAEADQLVTRWAKLPDEAKLADLMHDATLAQIDPAKPYVDGDDKARYMTLQGRFNALSAEAKQVYTDTRDSYQAHHAKVRSAIKDRIERSEIKGERKAALLKQMDDEFFKAIKGVYFPLARFGRYAVTVKGPDGKVESVSRAETKAEAEALRNNLLSAFPRDKGFTVGRVMLSKDFIADRDAVGRGFMTELYQVLDKQDMDATQRAELEDTLGQLYLSSLPDLSWAKHGIHRKGTPGFSQDARRAYAQNMFHGARYLAKLRYSDLMQDELTAMQKHVDDWRDVEDFDQNSAQRVVDEMNKRHESLMNPKSNPLSTALTSLGFVFHLGLSPASAMVNLSQTALVAYPIMGAKWGFGKASAALLKASQQAAKGKNDITGALNAEERAAYDEAVRAGTIDVTMAHDLAGIAQGEDAGVMWKIRPVMRWASFLFHHAERFNRQVTFVAAYRLAREAGADNKAAFEQATKATYDGHFDYSASNRARIMQGNVAKVLLLFKQYGQNMVYTLSRNAYQSINGTDAEKAEARKVLAGLLTSHAMAAGVLGLPMVTTLLAAASMIGGDDDEPWDAKVALQNLLADTFGQKPAEVLAHGLSRLTPWDISGRVGLDRLIFPDVQEGLEGQRLAESAMAAALGPVAGIGVNMLKGAQHMSEGRYALGLEAMLPSALRGPVKAIRYANEGVQDKSGISILDEVSPAAVAGQALGFSPSQARNAQEGKSAVMAHDRALGERRQELLTKAARASMAKDAEALDDARKEIARFNEKNPTRRITPLNVLQSVRNRNKRIDQAQDGVYLPRNRRDAMDAGRFAFAGTD